VEEIGSPAVDWQGVKKALDEINCDGWVNMESFVPGIPEIEKAASRWRVLVPSQEALAVEGGAFLRNVFCG
jgi:D-psicose/D-tagatose/L-ribulose 3-epimerase